MIDTKEKIVRSLVDFLCIIIISTVAICIYIIYFDQNGISTSEAESVVNEVMAKLELSYLDGVDYEEMVEGAISGVLASTNDPYTRYIPQEDYDENYTKEGKKYYGIGIQITYDDESDGALILSVMPDSPSERAGLLIGDVLQKVEGKVITADTYNDIIDTIKGEKNTKINLTIKREEEVKEFSVERDEIDPVYVSSKVIEKNIGYIKLAQFNLGCSSKFIEEVKELEDKGVSKIIIDLRNNPGGILDEVVEIGDYLLPEGIIIKEVYKTGREKVYKSDKEELDMEIVVLINERSASASEVLSGALKDLDKATLVGKNTFGKGIVQSIYSLKQYEGAIALTVAEYYTASGNKVHEVGISPHIEVDLEEQYKNSLYITEENDSQLKKAIEMLKK